MLHPGSGTGKVIATASKHIRLLRKGCTNRPFFHIVLATARTTQHMPVVEQLGTYDPVPNEHNEKLVSLNLERINYWIGNGAHCTRPVLQVLGLAGYYPVHPSTYMTAWRNRRSLEAAALKAAEESAGKSNEDAKT